MLCHILSQTTVTIITGRLVWYNTHQLQPKSGKALVDLVHRIPMLFSTFDAKLNGFIHSEVKYIPMGF